jgi:hypothetical protein
MFVELKLNLHVLIFRVTASTIRRIKIPELVSYEVKEPRFWRSGSSEKLSPHFPRASPGFQSRRVPHFLMIPSRR